MLDALPDQYYTCNKDNIFISEKFLWAAHIETKSKTMVHGVFQKRVMDYPTLLYKKFIQKIEKKLIS